MLNEDDAIDASKFVSLLTHHVHTRNDILEGTMRGICWGDKDAPGDKGGLQQLIESMQETVDRVPKYLDVIKKGQSLCLALAKEKVKEQV